MALGNLLGGKKGPKAPDYSQFIGGVTNLANDAAGWGRQDREWGVQRGQEVGALQRDVTGRQLSAADQLTGDAARDRARYDDTFVPLQDQFIDEAQSYDSEGRRQLERGRAMADVATSFDAVRRNAQRELESFGVDPSSVRSAALDVGVRTQQAAEQARAAQAAGQRTEDIGREMRRQAIDIGAPLPGQAMQGQTAGAGISGQALTGGLNTAGMEANLRGTGLDSTGQAMQGYTAGANMQNMQYGNQMQQAQFNQQRHQNILGNASAVGSFAMGFADGGQVPSPIPTAPLPIMGGDMGGMEMGGPPVQDPAGPVDYGPTDGSGVDDQVPAMLSVGEYVIPADVVAMKGREFFDKLIAKYHTPADDQQMMGAVA